jgi:hypothetical protein
MCQAYVLFDSNPLIRDLESYMIINYTFSIGMRLLKGWNAWWLSQTKLQSQGCPAFSSQKGRNGDCHLAVQPRRERLRVRRPSCLDDQFFHVVGVDLERFHWRDVKLLLLNEVVLNVCFLCRLKNRAIIEGSPPQLSRRRWLERGC